MITTSHSPSSPSSFPLPVPATTAPTPSLPTKSKLSLCDQANPEDETLSETVCQKDNPPKSNCQFRSNTSLSNMCLASLLSLKDQSLVVSKVQNQTTTKMKHQIPT